MKIKGTLLIMFILGILTVPAYGDEDNYRKIGDVNVSDSMDVIKEGDVNVLVPKGEQLQQQSSFVVKEGDDAYASRKFSNMEERFSQLEKEVVSQKKDIKALQEAVDRLSREKK